MDTTKQHDEGYTTPGPATGKHSLLVLKFLERKTRDVERMRAALLAEDLEQIRTIGYQIKESGASRGIDWLSDLGSQIETAAEAGHLPSVRRRIEMLDRSLSDPVLRNA